MLPQLGDGHVLMHSYRSRRLDPKGKPRDVIGLVSICAFVAGEGDLLAGELPRGGRGRACQPTG